MKDPVTYAITITKVNLDDHSKDAHMKHAFSVPRSISRHELDMEFERTVSRQWKDFQRFLEEAEA